MSRPMWRGIALGVLCTLAVPVVAVGILALDVVLYGIRMDAGPADAAIVLGAAVYDDRPSPVFEERIRHAVGLARAGRVRTLVMTGGRSPEDRLSEAEAAGRWAMAEGIPRGAIALETQSRTTADNLAFALPLLEERGARRVLVVSDPLHLRRAIGHARRLGLDAHPSPTRTSRYRGWGPWTHFLMREAYFFGRCRLRAEC